MYILLASHTPTATTGYGRVTRRLAQAFRNAGHMVTALGSGYNGEAHELSYPILPWPNDRPAQSLAAALRDVRPDVLLTIGDPWMFDFVPAFPERANVKWIAYLPVDGRPLPEEWKRWIEAIDLPVVFSKFTQDLVAAAIGRPPTLIYHGVDTQSFRPADRAQAKQRAHIDGHFVVGTVARNQQRKNLPALMRAFATFATGKPDVLLYLHTQTMGEWDLPALARQLGIEAKTRVTAELTTDTGVPDPVLATVYNAMDLFVLPTMAEGFGLPIMEAQACGTPALVTDFSACPELVVDPIQRLKVKDILIMRRNFEQAIVDTDDIAAKLEYFYRNPDKLADVGRRCHAFAQQFEWSIACDQFVKLLETIEPVRKPNAGGNGQPARSIPPSSPAADEAIQAARREIQANQPAAAESRLEALLAREPRHPEALKTLASLLHPQRRLEEAIDLLRRYLEVVPDDPPIVNSLGVLLAEAGKAAEAVTLFERSVRLNPNFAEAHNNLAVALETAGKLQEAEAAYRRAIALNPKYTEAQNNLGNTLRKLHRVREALAQHRKAIELNPSYGPAYHAIASACDELAEPEEAYAVRQRLLKMQPVDAQLHSDLLWSTLCVPDVGPDERFDAHCGPEKVASIVSTGETGN